MTNQIKNFGEFVNSCDAFERELAIKSKVVRDMFLCASNKDYAGFQKAREQIKKIVMENSVDNQTVPSHDVVKYNESVMEDLANSYASNPSGFIRYAKACAINGSEIVINDSDIRRKSVSELIGTVSDFLWSKMEGREMKHYPSASEAKNGLKQLSEIAVKNQYIKAQHIRIESEKPTMAFYKKVSDLSNEMAKALVKFKKQSQQVQKAQQRKQVQQPIRKQANNQR